MPRPKKMRFISKQLTASSFIPENIAPSGTRLLPLEAMEAIRLSDFEGMDRETAALQMGVSRQTFGRILTQAREIIAEALVRNMRLQIEGGTYAFHDGPRRRRRRGRMS